MNQSILLTLLTVVPFLGAVLVAAVPTDRSLLARRIALAVTGFAFVLTGAIWISFDATSGAVQLVHRFEWIPTLHVDYFVGIDGLGLVMIGLTSLVLPMAMLASRRVTENIPMYYALLLFLQAGLYGTFTALNFFHWFLFWELTLIPAFFLIKFWGGPLRSGAAIQFFVYTMVGSIALLVGFLGLYLATGTFDFIQLAELARTGGVQKAIAARINWPGMDAEQVYSLMAVGVLFGFAVKVPMVPFHSWLPLTYSQAPTPVTMVLTGVMSKMGVYGLLRLFLPIFPHAIDSFMTILLWLAIATVVLSAGAALVQTDLKRMFAYSSINHLGYCLLGIFAAAHSGGDVAGLVQEKAAVLNGVVLQMFNHGITAAALFCFLVYLEDRSGGKTGIGEFGGLRKVAPVFCGLMGISLFASLGLPGLNGFVGEFLIFKGVFALSAWAAVLALPGLLVTAVFILTVMQKVFHGPLNAEWKSLPDLTNRERLIVLPATALMFVVGLFPGLLVQIINPTVIRLTEGLRF